MRNLTLTLSAAALALSGAAFAQPAAAMHHEGKGDMTRAEAQAHAEKKFAKMDANGDGTINQADRAARETMRFEKLDTDRNGSISRAEFDAFHAQKGAGKGDRAGKMGHHRMGKKGGKGMGGDGTMTMSRQQFVTNALAMFDKADANRDGTVTIAERRTAMQAMRGEWKARKAAAAPQG